MAYYVLILQTTSQPFNIKLIRQYTSNSFPAQKVEMKLRSGYVTLIELLLHVCDKSCEKYCANSFRLFDSKRSHYFRSNKSSSRKNCS